MRISEEKISHMTHLLKTILEEHDSASIIDTSTFLRNTKKIIADYCRIEDEVDTFVRQKISSYSREIIEGSREWDVMYKKHYEDEMKKR